jgi:uncharacterized protein (TIRG00374 family)
MRFNWKVWLGVLVSAVFFAWFLQGLSLDQVWRDLTNANYWYLIPGVGVYFLAVWARTWRWQYLLRPMATLPLRRLFPIVVIGYMGNNVYPARAGEVIRSYVLLRNAKVPVSASLATVLVERVFDGLVMLLFVFVTVPFVDLPGWLNFTVVAATAAFTVALGVLVAVALWPQVFLGFYDRLERIVVPARFRGRIRGILELFCTGLSALRHPRHLAMVLFTSVLIWLTETTKYWVLMHGFPFQVPFLVLMLMTAVVNLATTIPSAPGYVGTFDAPGIKTLTAFGVPESVAAGYTLVLHAALLLPITLLGFFYMWRESVSWSDFRTAAKPQITEA